ncbi:hypothetical protein [Amycolatopsis sp. NPDC051071]
MDGKAFGSPWMVSALTRNSIAVCAVRSWTRSQVPHPRASPLKLRRR